MIKIDDYKKCLLNDEVLLKSQQRFISNKHDVYTEDVNKIALSNDDDKKIIRRVTQTISKHLGGNYIVLPTNENDIEKMAPIFYNFHGFPQCIGSVDDMHIGVETPSLNVSHFINRKGKYN